MYFSLKKLDKAKLACEKILAENPNDSTALSQLVAVLRNMADVQEKAGNHTEAVASRKSA